MKVRTAVPDDAPAISALHVRAWQVAYAGTIPAGYLMSMDVEARTVRRRELLESVTPPQACFVVDDGTGVCGFAAVGDYRADTPEPGIGEVYAIYVHPSRWSTGAGLALMRACVAYLSGAGCTEIRLWVLDANPRARRFYERFGFTADGAAKMFVVDEGGPYQMQVREIRYVLPVR